MQKNWDEQLLPRIKHWVGLEYVLKNQEKISVNSGIFGNLFSKKNTQTVKMEAELDFEEKRSQLDQRIGVIEQGLARCGIKSVQLGTEEVVEVFYKVFNPGEIEDKISLE